MTEELQSWLFDDLFNEERIEERLRKKFGVEISIYIDRVLVLKKTLSYDEIIIGRSDPTVDADIDLTPFDEEKTISRRSLIVRRDGGGYSIVRTGNARVLFISEKIEMERDQPYMLKRDADNLFAICGKERKIGVKIRVVSP